MKYKLIILLFIAFPVIAENNTCEQDALKYQHLHGGSLVFVQPLNPDGSYNLGRYNGHWLNYIKGEYIDAASGMIMNTPQSMYDVKVEWWDMSIDHPPFSLWHS